MKRGWSKKKEVRAAMIAGAGVVLCVGTLLIVQARRNILNATKPYADKDTFKILEIVPSHGDHAGEEIGYFVGDGMPQGQADFMDVSVAKSFGGRSPSTTPGSASYEAELENLLNMRRYGLIKYLGTDTGIYATEVSEYPVYSDEANFQSSKADGYVSLDNEFTSGTYMETGDNTGYYKLKDDDPEYDYRIEPDETGRYRIWRVSRTTVSGPTVSGPSVSESDILKVAVTEHDPSNPKLPEGIVPCYDAEGMLAYTGNVSFIPDAEAGEYYGYTNSHDYVREVASDSNKFYNGNWFKEYVLGDGSSVKTVTVDTKAANLVTASMLQAGSDEAYDLIYVSGSYDDYYGGGVDMSDDTVKKLFNLATHAPYQAVIMDYALLGPSSGVNPTNIEKLALMLWQEDQTDLILSNSSLFGADTSANITALPAATDTIWSVFGASVNSVRGVTNGTFVCGSVYVYRHAREYFDSSKSQLDAEDVFANGDFASKYTNTIISDSFSDVLAYVQMNNLNYVDERVADEVTPALIIQYILAYDGTTASLIKTDLRILEIQPVRAFLYNTYVGTTSYDDCDATIKSNRKKFIKLFLDDRFNSAPNTVAFTSMTIEEFIGKNEDPNETYDLIYIGSNIKHTLKDGSGTGHSYTYYYTQTGFSKQAKADPSGTISLETVKTTITDFTDNYMDGMVYYNVGDTYYVGTADNSNWRYDSSGHAIGTDSLLGIINDGTIFGWKYDDHAHNQSQARFSGRDLTDNKLKQMKDYLKTGYPVVVAGDLMCTLTDATGTNKRTINPTTYSWSVADQGVAGYDHGRVDNSSKLYELFQYAIDGIAETDEHGATISVDGGDIPNLVSEFDVKNEVVTKNTLAGYLNKPKLTLNLTSRPVEYSYTTRLINMDGHTEPVVGTQTQLTPDPTTGKYYLDYEFTITNATTFYTGGDTYGVHLYVDINADGKFSESEELADCTVTNAVTGASVPFTSSVNGRAYSLQPNVLYKLRREVPEGYLGILPWCLQVVMNSNTSYRASETGYSKLPRPTDDKEEINILQISRGANTYDVNVGKITCNISYEMSQYSIPTSGHTHQYYYMGAYLSNLDDYEVNVTTITQLDYEKNYVSKLSNYNMLILGFADCYDAFNDRTAVQALVDYMNSGKPVLLTHDLIMFRSTDTQTEMLRNIVGMDRYGCLDKTVKYGSVELLRSGVGYTRSSDPNQVKEIEKAGYRIVYQPGRAREKIDFQTQGLSNLTMVRYAYGQYSGNSNAKRSYINWGNINSMVRSNWDDQQSYVVHSINKGQITTYPYILPDSFAVGKTHNQYYQLDLDADLDDDGETDIVVWYTLGNQAGKPDWNEDGGSRYWVTPNDVVNNYYIYNKGNITYSGVGHSAPASTAEQKYEAQLFVNTMIAAYRAGIRVPTIRMYETDNIEAEPVNSMAIAYDKNIGKNADVGDSESSLIKDDEGNYINAFVNDGDDATKAYFQINDPNFVKGTKSIEAKFYIASDTAGVIEGTGLHGVEVPVTVYSSDFATTCDASNLKSGVRYGIKLPLSQLKTKGEIKLYVTAKTTISSVSVSNSIVTNESPLATTEFTIRKVDLLKLD